MIDDLLRPAPRGSFYPSLQCSLRDRHSLGMPPFLTLLPLPIRVLKVVDGVVGPLHFVDDLVNFTGDLLSLRHPTHNLRSRFWSHSRQSIRSGLGGRLRRLGGDELGDASGLLNSTSVLLSLLLPTYNLRGRFWNRLHQ